MISKINLSLATFEVAFYYLFWQHNKNQMFLSFFSVATYLKKTGFIESDLPILLLCVLKILLISLPFAFVYSLLLLFLLCSFCLQQITPYMQYHIYRVLYKPKMRYNIHPGPRICGPDPWYNSGGPAKVGLESRFLLSK